MDDDYFDLKYADNELLPKDKPVGYPHVIQDLHDETDPTDLCLADGVATILYNLNVEILEVFLDVNGPSVELYCNRKYAHHIFMNRHDNIVECGFIDNDTLRIAAQYVHSIDSNGKWKAESAAIDVGYPDPIPEGEKEKMEEVATHFTKNLLLHRIWEIPKAQWRVLVDDKLRKDLLGEQTG